jgi:predicted Zn-ribbon and HTH transcriptional regulator
MNLLKGTERREVHGSIRSNGLSEREAIVETVPKIREGRETIVGTAFMVTRILCKYCGFERRRDKKICETPRENG